MVEVTLSDHTADQSSSAAAKREADFKAAREKYENAVASLMAKGESLKQALVNTWQARKYGAWFLSLFPRIGHAFSGFPAPPRMADASRDEVVWNAGGEGEQLVSDALRRVLNDEWVVVSGYKNRGGEIDKIIVGRHPP